MRNCSTKKQRFHNLIHNAPFGMIVIDENGKFTYANPKFTEIFGYDLSDVPDGKRWFELAYPDSEYRNQVVSAWIEDLKAYVPGEKRPRIFDVTCKDGSRKTIHFIPVSLKTGENLISLEDITGRIGPGGSASPGTENGVCGPSGRRGSTRFQQYASGDHRICGTCHDKDSAGNTP